MSDIPKRVRRKRMKAWEMPKNPAYVVRDTPPRNRKQGEQH